MRPVERQCPNKLLTYMHSILSQYEQRTLIGNNINQEWFNIRTNIYHLALKTLGTRRRQYGNRGLRTWGDDIALLKNRNFDTL